MGNLSQAHDGSEVLATLAFFMELDRLKAVERRNHLADGSRRENTAEHSWHLGMAALVFAPYATESVDVGRAVAMALAHDIVEIDAGDTFAYDQGADAASKEERENAAADRIFGLLPPDLGPSFRALWEEFESSETPDARFAKSLDRVQPVMANLMSGGGTWATYNVTFDQLEARVGSKIAKGAPGLWDWVKEKSRPWFE